MKTKPCLILVLTLLLTTSPIAASPTQLPASSDLLHQLYVLVLEASQQLSLKIATDRKDHPTPPISEGPSSAEDIGPMIDPDGSPSEEEIGPMIDPDGIKSDGGQSQSMILN